MTGASLGIGIIGAGNIAAAYLRLLPRFAGVRVVAVADRDPAAAEARGTEFGVRAQPVDALLAADDVDIVVNLTVPAAHRAVSEAALRAGKHVHSEKPFVLSVEDGRALADLAGERGLRVGSAPDTFLGGSHQLARKLVDDGAIGSITSAACFVQSPGMEMWHPSPDFFFQPGGGPVLDLGPYYLTNLVQLLGPVSEVAATTGMGAPVRTITSAPRAGQTITVNTPTTVHALLVFASGAQVMYGTSWDVWSHSLPHMEVYGATGTLALPDPNFFGGEVRMTDRGAPVNAPGWDHPFGRTNEGARANWRGAAVADMAQAITQGRPHRCDLPLALHVVDAMTAILRAGESRQPVRLTTTCQRPAALPPEAAATLLA